MDAVVVTAEQVRSAVSMPDAIAALRRGFLDLAAGHFEMPTRTALADGQFLVMSAAHRPTRSAIVKTLSVNFGRTPSITGTVVWSELDRERSLIADAGAVTALRTGAAVGVATDLLAAPDARVLTLFGTGEQSYDQVRAVHAVRPLDRVIVIDRHPGRTPPIIEVLTPELPDTDLHVGTDDIASALAAADIVCCATPATEPLFAAEALAECVHVNAIGSYRRSMRELPDELLAGSTVVVDQRDAVLEESGEILHAIDAGAITTEDLVELGNALTDPQHHAGRTVFKSVGIAMQDWVIASLLAAEFLS